MNRSLRVTGWVMIALGAVILEFAAYELWGTSLVTKGHQNELRKQFAAEATASPTPSAPAAPARTRNPRAIALLKIPRIDVNVIVVEGVRLSDLSYGPGRYPQTSRIGAQGTTAIAGHRTGWGSPFLNVDRLRTGDEITLELPGGTTFRYRVSGTRVVSPGASWVLRGNPDSRAQRQLTLTTCTPKFTSRDRLIIWADLIGEASA